jgi:hypothetical protein
MLATRFCSLRSQKGGMCLIFWALPEKSNTLSHKYASEASNRSEFIFYGK